MSPNDRDDVQQPEPGGNFFPPGLAVRKISPTDNEEVRNLFIQSQAGLLPGDADLDTRIALKKYTDSCVMADLAKASVYYSSPGRNMWLLESQEHEIVAMVAIDSDPDDETPEIALMTRLCVSPEFRRKGVAELLSKRAEQWATKQGFTTLKLYVSELQKEALSLYEKLEYSRVGSGNYGPIEVLELQKTLGTTAGKS